MNKMDVALILVLQKNKYRVHIASASFMLLSASQSEDPDDK